MSFLERIAACNRHDLSRYRPFLIDGQRLGWVRDDFAARLRPFADVFAVSTTAVSLADGLVGFEARSAAVDGALRQIAAEGVITGWRGEYYPVGDGFSAPPLLRMERAAVPHFGVRAFGVHLNGYVRDGERLFLWIARRAADRQTYPGMLDNMVAGGQPIGIGLRDNLVKECAEEASLPAALAARAVAVGAVSYCQENAAGIKPDLMFSFDLELPADFRPRPQDGEISEFYLWPAEDVLARVRDSEEFKPNCNLILIDFFIRHGLLDPEDPDYGEIVTALHQ